MIVVNKIFGIFRRSGYVPRREVFSLKGLALERFREEFSRILHDLLVRHSAEFITDALSRKESPFHGLEKGHFFHEMMAINLWALQKVFPKPKHDITADVHRQYAKTFHPEDGPAALYSLDAFLAKCRKYRNTWDDHTGHQDRFGQQAGEYLFGAGSEVPRGHEVSFWIVSYTDSLLKKLRDLRKKCAAADLSP